MSKANPERKRALHTYITVYFIIEGLVRLREDGKPLFHHPRFVVSVTENICLGGRFLEDWLPQCALCFLFESPTFTGTQELFAGSRPSQGARFWLYCAANDAAFKCLNFSDNGLNREPRVVDSLLDFLQSFDGLEDLFLSFLMISEATYSAQSSTTNLRLGDLCAITQRFTQESCSHYVDFHTAPLGKL